MVRLGWAAQVSEIPRSLRPRPSDEDQREGHQHSSFCAGDKCLFALERGTSQHAGSVSKFCPAAGSWERIASSNPIPSQTLGWAYHSGHLYGTHRNTVQSLNVSTGQREALPPISTSRRYATLCVVDGRLFVIGGGRASVEEYVAMERRWVSVPDMPRAVTGAAAVALDGKVLVIGGWDSSPCFPLTTVLEINLGNRSWKPLPSLLTARAFCTVTVLEGDVVVIGGDGLSDKTLKSVERYNRRLQCWEAMPSLTDPSFESAAVVVQV